VQAALYENNIFLVGQHMLQYAITGQPAAPMPARISPWGIYDVFTVKAGEQIFLAAVSDAQWQTFCDVLGFPDLKADPRYASNNNRVELRSELLAELRARLAPRSAAEISRTMEDAGLPFAPIMKPEDLLDDPHLLATGGLADIRLTDGARAGQTVKTTLFPFTLDGERLGVKLNPPKRGEHSREVLREIGLSDAEVDALIESHAVA
jgi:crotonobetainyl-CoA:carnitine CoA-transferase CaiB-like acyl-CoA transferase